MTEVEPWVLTGASNIMGEALVFASPFEGPRIPDGERVEVVPAEQLAGAVEAAEKATALAERYGEAIIAISAALPNENRVRAIIASLDTGAGHA